MGFAVASSARGPSFELLEDVSTGSGRNFRLGFVTVFTCDLSSGASLELLADVSTGSGKNRLLGFTGSSDCFGVSFELLVVVSTGSTANRRGFLTIVLAASTELWPESDMTKVLRAKEGRGRGSYSSRPLSPHSMKSLIVLNPGCGGDKR